jgi:hypothetical protein
LTKKDDKKNNKDDDNEGGGFLEPIIEDISGFIKGKRDIPPAVLSL